LTYSPQNSKRRPLSPGQLAIPHGSNGNRPPSWQRLASGLTVPRLPSATGWPAPRPTPTAAPTPDAIPDPLTWARQDATLVHPTRGRLAFEPYPYQVAFLAAHRAPRRIVLKARQIGFSQVFAIEALYYAIHQPEITILLVSRSQDLAVNLLRYCYQAYNNLRKAPPLVKENESEMGFANGSRIKSIPANRSTGRGFAATRVYLDEFAYAAYDDSIYQSVSPTVAQGGSLTVGSTPDGNTNLFYELWEHGHDFTRIYAPWYHCPAYNPDGAHLAGIDEARAREIGEAGEWYRRERPKYTAQQWAAEYGCDFNDSGAAVFDRAAIDRAEDGAVGEQPPNPEHRYLAMADIGRRSDPTVINVVDLDTRPLQRVYHERIERAPYPIIQQRLADVARRYQARLLVESNGVGDPVIENTDYPAEPFVTTVRSKVQAIQSLVLLLERGDLKAKWTPQERRELRAYRWDDQSLVQDCVMSLAIGASILAEATQPLILFGADDVSD